MKTRVAAIIPALNEAPTIGSVVEALNNSSLVEEIIVISDGSTDGTPDIARASGATTVIEHDRPHGKGAALRFGASQTNAGILLFLDADLKRLNANHIEQLLLPVISGARHMNIGLLPKGPLTNIQKYVMKISGQRALRRDIIESIPEKFTQGFMIETAMTRYCKAHKKPFGMVVLRGVGVRRKFEKIRIDRAAWQYTKMWFEILKAHLAISWARFNGKF